jgi:hypothetical protein
MPPNPETSETQRSPINNSVRKNIKTESKRSLEKDKESKKGDFSEEFQGQEVVIQLSNPNERLIGRLEEARRYWIKLIIFPENRVYYINKAWIVYIQPLKAVRK